MVQETYSPNGKNIMWGLGYRNKCNQQQQPLVISCLLKCDTCVSHVHAQGRDGCTYHTHEMEVFCESVEKLLLQNVLPKMLASEGANSLERGKLDSCNSFQNSIPLSFRFDWKKGSACNSQSSICNSVGCSFTTEEIGSVNRWMRGCILCKSWKRSLNCSCNNVMSVVYQLKGTVFSHSDMSVCKSAHVWKWARFSRSNDRWSLNSSKFAPKPIHIGVKSYHSLISSLCQAVGYSLVTQTPKQIRGMKIGVFKADKSCLEVDGRCSCSPVVLSYGSLHRTKG